MNSGARIRTTRPAGVGMETFYDVLRRQGISRRSFLKFCSLTATSLGLGSYFAPQIEIGRAHV